MNKEEKILWIILAILLVLSAGYIWFIIHALHELMEFLEALAGSLAKDPAPYPGEN